MRAGRVISLSGFQNDIGLWLSLLDKFVIRTDKPLDLRVVAKVG